MTVNCAIANRKNKSTSFPKIMIGTNGTIVLFSEYGVGTVLNTNKYHDTGYYFTDWQMDQFKDFDNQITLENEQ